MDLGEKIFEEFKVLKIRASKLENRWTPWCYVKIADRLYAAKRYYFRKSTPYIIFSEDFVEGYDDTKRLVTKEFTNIDLVRTKKGTAWRVVPGNCAVIEAVSDYMSRGKWAPDVVWFKPHDRAQQWVIYHDECYSRGGGAGEGILFLKVPMNVLGTHTPLAVVRIRTTATQTEKFIVYADNTIAPEEVAELGLEAESD